MTSDRPYRVALGFDEALDQLRKGAGAQWDAEVVGTLLHLLDSGVVSRIAKLIGVPA
jgi:HD-GYP domain-containing protein (c-di-GMP phosphodiesterase class II)